jgi:histidinol dehydrogenase
LREGDRLAIQNALSKGWRMIEIRTFHPDDERFQAILRRGEIQDADVRKTVEEILEAVRTRGDAAVLEFTETFDHAKLTADRLKVPPAEFEAAQTQVAEEFLTAVALARVNIRKFHEYQRRSGYIHDDGDGVRLAKRVMPLGSVGVYVPAGAAPLFSSLLMNAIPAQIAGVERIQVATPPRADGSVDPHILVTAKSLGLGDVFRMGGAQAVAAFAYGTSSIPRVDKIVGPGNA